MVCFGTTKKEVAMTKRHSLWANLIIIGIALLAGCESSMGTWQAYPGEKLPDTETALIKRGSDLDYWKIDGKTVLDEFNYRLIPIVPSPLSFSWARKAARVLPGEHEIVTGYWNARWGSKSITFEAVAGRVYTLFGKRVKETKLVGKGDTSGIDTKGDYVWMEDESGTVIAGEKPPG